MALKHCNSTTKQLQKVQWNTLSYRVFFVMIQQNRYFRGITFCMALHLNWLHCAPVGRSLGLALSHSPLCLFLGLLMLLIVLPCPDLICPGTWPYSPLLEQETPPCAHVTKIISDLSVQYHTSFEISSTSGFRYTVFNDIVIYFVQQSLWQRSALEEPNIKFNSEKRKTAQYRHILYPPL